MHAQTAPTRESKQGYEVGESQWRSGHGLTLWCGSCTMGFWQVSGTHAAPAAVLAEPVVPACQDAGLASGLLPPAGVT